LDDSKYSDIEYIIKGLKSREHQEEKHLILVSNIMTWAKTSPKIKKDANNEENLDNSAQDSMDGDNDNDKDKDKDDVGQENKEDEPEEDDIVNELFEDPDEKDNPNPDDKIADNNMEGEPVRIILSEYIYYYTII
jgi:hypothetical protein